ncbi:GAP family protein [Mycobacterium sp. 236(2023)]|uniref:GAP family protein n=1 Tax=Mycobacterium sp. 236(2023) TaxID=3038163 RepID=UPI002414FE1A|nr:GAP family protein [Mycobacterium sp. 236(2023)]MDG4667261.1 GAP family protein [Mycobacterium sp. 236(2023)]
MSPHWSSALAELVPLSMVIALSPLTIIPAVLVLHAARPKLTGPAFLAGWTIGLGSLTALFVLASNLLGGNKPEPPAWTTWVRIGIGVALIVLGVYRWVSRHAKPHQIPGTRHLIGASPARALVIGILLAGVNPKVFFICAAAGLTLATLTMGSGAGAAATVFIALSASTVALPVLAYCAFDDRLGPLLDRIKDWMEKYTSAVMASILVLIGLVVLLKGIQGL